MGPRNAATLFSEQANGAARCVVTLYGSLAATGKGHLTDKAILDVLSPQFPTTIEWKPDIVMPFHTNAMKFQAFDAEGNETLSRVYYSVGGGDIVLDGESRTAGESYWEYVGEIEGDGIWDYLSEVWEVMKDAVKRGIDAEGVLPGGLGVRRKAVSYFIHASGYNASLKSRGLVYAYALAVSEENASGGRIVTAPTCGSCGIVPAVLYHLHTSKGFSEKRILRALATAGLFGNVVKHNASVSGAEVGCQGEVGVACAMAAAAASQLFGGTPAQIEYSAEMGLEHHLGLTCDPVCGLVQIPCIERNAYAAARALDANLYAAFSDGRHSVDFDRIVEVMKQTGHDIPSLYKETAQGGLAVIK